MERLLRRQHRGGQPAQVQGAVLIELQEGLQAGRWKRAKEIQQWLAQQHRKKMGLSGVYYWLGKLGGVLKVPRKTHAHQDVAAVVASPGPTGGAAVNAMLVAASTPLIQPPPRSIPTTVRFPFRIRFAARRKKQEDIGFDSRGCLAQGGVARGDAQVPRRIFIFVAQRARNFHSARAHPADHPAF